MLENVLKGGSTTSGKKQAKHQSATGTNLSDFRLEYAKSGGSTCGVCEEKIKKVNLVSHTLNDLWITLVFVLRKIKP